MDRAEALARLGLDSTATPAEIDSAWRDAMRVVHPDGSHPDPQAAIQLNEARAVAVSGDAQPAGALVPLSALLEIVRARDAGADLVPHRLPIEPSLSERAMRKVVMHHVGLLSRRKRVRFAAAIATEGIAVVAGLLTALLHLAPGDDVNRFLLGMMTTCIALLGAAFALLGWRASAAERQLRHELEEVEETLSDRAAVADTLDEIGVGDFWTRTELYQALDDWGRRWADEPPDRRLRTQLMMDFVAVHTYESAPLVHTATRIGRVDFAKLLLTKGIELGLIEESTSGDDRGAAIYGYARRR